jgi:hypothetical protein
VTDFPGVAHPQSGFPLQGTIRELAEQSLLSVCDLADNRLGEAKANKPCRTVPVAQRGWNAGKL